MGGNKVEQFCGRYFNFRVAGRCETRALHHVESFHTEISLALFVDRLTEPGRVDKADPTHAKQVEGGSRRATRENDSDTFCAFFKTIKYRNLPLGAQRILLLVYAKRIDRGASSTS